MREKYGKVYPVLLLDSSFQKVDAKKFVRASRVCYDCSFKIKGLELHNTPVVATSFMLTSLTAFFYVTGGIAQALVSLRKNNIHSFWLYGFSLIAVTMHGYLLYHWIDLNAGQNLTQFNLLSLATWVTILFVLLLTLQKPLAYLEIVLFPLAAASIFLASLHQSPHIIQTANDPKQIMHIFLSVITFSILCIAGLQAVTLAIQEKLIRHTHWATHGFFPPIETMEKVLFQMIATGSLLLSCLLISSIYFFHTILLEQFLQKTVLTFIAWLVFTLLLIGRQYFGWRGRKAIYWTLSGVALISIIYYGSMIIMEFLP